MDHLIIIVILLILVFIYYNQKNIITEGFECLSKLQSVCKKLYIEDDNKHYCVIKNLVDKEFCQQMIKSGEDYAKVHGWTKKRHENYPTTDNEVTTEWKEYAYMRDHAVKKMACKIKKLYGISKKKIGINEIFIVKYDIKGQRYLNYHQDGSEFSFVLALNDDYEGGGTKFKHNGKTIKLDIGDCLVFSGQTKHRGNEITSGQRYILAGFLNYNGPTFCSNYISNL